MSKTRSIIMSVLVEGCTQAETARLYDVSPGWVSKLVARYRLEGDAAFEARSRRPHTSPQGLDPATIVPIIDLRQDLTDRGLDRGLDSGPDTIRWHLQQHHGLVVSRETIWRHLKTAGLIVGKPSAIPDLDGCEIRWSPRKCRV